MTAFLVEAYAPLTTIDDIERRARDAAEKLSAEGTPVRYVRSILIPDDETCFFMFEATSAVAVQEVAQRAGCVDARVSRAIESSQTEEGPDEDTTS